MADPVKKSEGKPRKEITTRENQTTKIPISGGESLVSALTCWFSQGFVGSFGFHQICD